ECFFEDTSVISSQFFPTQLPVIGCCLCHGHLDWPLPSWCVCVCVCFGVCVGGWVDRIRLVWVHVNIGVHTYEHRVVCVRVYVSIGVSLWKYGLCGVCSSSAVACVCVCVYVCLCQCVCVCVSYG